MAFSSLLGQPTVVKFLERALEGGRVHHAYRFEGPDGVGKELAARLLAQALVCERRGPDAPLGCEQCSACRRALSTATDNPATPLHPDVLLVALGLYPPELIGKKTREVSAISVEQVRRIVLSRAGFPPHEGRALVIIVRDAEELSIAAANALLKTLEEPPANTHFILLSSRPNRLLDTLRSRSLAVRFRPLGDDVVAQLLERQGLPTSVAELAGGSMTAALELADTAAIEARDGFVNSVDQALDAPDLVSALSAVQGGGAEKRDDLANLFEHLGSTYALRARALASSEPSTSALWAARHQLTLRALAELERNAQAGLALEAFVTRLRRS